MQHAMRSLKTLLFVGCGEGLHDHNFGALVEAEPLPAPDRACGFRQRHLQQTVALQVQHPAEQRVFVLGYGSDHNSLAALLRRVRPAPGSKLTQTEAFAPARPALLPPAPRCWAAADGCPALWAGEGLRSQRR